MFSPPSNVPRLDAAAVSSAAATAVLQLASDVPSSICVFPLCFFSSNRRSHGVENVSSPIFMLLQLAGSGIAKLIFVCIMAFQ